MVKNEKKLEYYDDYKITKKVLQRIDLIDLKRIKEEITDFSAERISSLKEMSKLYEESPKNQHVILGEDWYLVYSKSDEGDIEIKDLVAIYNVENKFEQTMEMFNAIKKIFLENEQSDMYGALRHSTSYKFYKKMLQHNYIEEYYDIIEFDYDIVEIKQQILSEYDTIEDYLSDEFRNEYKELSLDDHIYHLVRFNIADKFKKRYKK